MIEVFRKADATEAVAALETIYAEEVGHVAYGSKWFHFLCGRHELDPKDAFHALVRRYFHGPLKPPFNEEKRAEAGPAAGFLLAADRGQRSLTRADRDRLCLHWLYRRTCRHIIGGFRATRRPDCGQSCLLARADLLAIHARYAALRWRHARGQNAVLGMRQATGTVRTRLAIRARCDPRAVFSRTAGVSAIRQRHAVHPSATVHAADGLFGSAAVGRLGDHRHRDPADGLDRVRQFPRTGQARPAHLPGASERSGAANATPAPRSAGRAGTLQRWRWTRSRRCSRELLASEMRRRELETGIDVIQTTLRGTMQEREAARADAGRARTTQTEAGGPTRPGLRDQRRARSTS